MRAVAQTQDRVFVSAIGDDGEARLARGRKPQFASADSELKR
jgi:hypothetical protein